MKKTIFILLCGFIVCLTAKAQRPAEMRMAVSYENITSSNDEQSQTSTTTASYRNDEDWRNSRKMRNAGVIVASVGYAGVITGVALILSCPERDSFGAGLNQLVDGFIVTGVMLAPTIAGSIIWGKGNSRMREARLKFTGKGLTYNF